MEILIEEMDGGLWVAAMEGRKLQGLEFDPPHEEVRWGSVYWAKVARIDKARDAAFVNLDGDNIGILHNADVRIRQKNGTWKAGGDKEIGKLLQPGQMVAVQAKSGFLPTDPDEPHARANGKSPRVSMNIALPGRFLIFAPIASENKVSQRIRDKKMRRQMQSVLDSMIDCHGCILRAAGANTQTDILMREFRILKEIWTQVSAYFTGDEPQLIMLGPDAVQRTLGDQASKRISRIEVSTMEHFQLAEEWCDIYAPDLVTRIKPMEIAHGNREFELFEHAGIVPQIDALLVPYAILPGGATIVIQETAALIAIDVNSAADNRGNLAINIDAAKEVARQLRLRNMGGAIVIDFLRLKDKEERARLVKTLEEGFAQDPCTVQIHGWSNLDMLEATRQRRTPSLAERYEGMMEEE